ncbi:hypothetical protein CTEN210_00951 [Chaetoceros tenuissimus]|uniref:tRNA (guanine(26)-N(2))-dimethyltransferase n=1 Tax=Chaetoceros tenuissimus TaxID=426638 RepID=A0AAD3GYW0_9STRA|nr:hypothetical protein CTEN210_00951 [Chaetoceros tenuissimus]
MASKPGSSSGFYNPKRRIGRDMVVLSTAHFLVNESRKHHEKSRKDGYCKEMRMARLLDATCATGIQGLRVYQESPILAKAFLSDIGETNVKIPDLNVILNDLDENALEIAKKNADSLNRENENQNTGVEMSQRVAQSLLHEETFEISVLDPFGSVQPFLDAAFARAPSNGMIEICATDVGVLYGTRPNMAKRHYNAHLSAKRPPCYRERGVRLMLAAIAQAAGRNDRGISPVYSISTEHFCLLSVKVLRGAKAADETANLIQPIKICQTCGASSSRDDAPMCDCEPDIQGVGKEAIEEGPIWVGPLHDYEIIKDMNSLADLHEASEFISRDTKKLLKTLEEEAQVKGMFHRRPDVAGKGNIPKLTNILERLCQHNFNSSRTHFCTKSIKTDATAKEFDAIVKTLSLESV